MFRSILILLLAASQSYAFKPVAKTRQIDLCLDQEWGEFVANPNDCKLFFLCGKNGEGVVASCPPNMLFNAETKLCDNPENVPCESESTTIQPLAIDTTTTIAEIASTITTDGLSQTQQYCYNIYNLQRNSYALVFLPHPRNCQQYYMCYHGQALLQSCTPNLNWNGKLGKCDLASNAECVISAPNESDDEGEEGQDVELWPSQPEPFGVDGLKCPEYGQHVFPNVKRCDSFIYCIKGQAVLQQCPFYQHFDVQSSRCRWRLKATCVKDLNLKNL